MNKITLPFLKAPSNNGSLIIGASTIPWVRRFTSKRTVHIRITTSFTFHNLNWDSGSRNTYSAVELATGRVITPDLGAAAPWANPVEGLRCEIPTTHVIVEHGVFMGKPSRPTVFINPKTLKDQQQ